MRTRRPVSLQPVLFQGPLASAVSLAVLGIATGTRPRARPRSKNQRRIVPPFPLLHHPPLSVYLALSVLWVLPPFSCFVLSFVSLLFLPIFAPSFYPWEGAVAAQTDAERPDLSHARHHVCDVSFPSQRPRFDEPQSHNLPSGTKADRGGAATKRRWSDLAREPVLWLTGRGPQVPDSVVSMMLGCCLSPVFLQVVLNAQQRYRSKRRA